MLTRTNEITTVIIDDLTAEREVLNEILFEYDEIEVVAEANNIMTGFTIIKKENPVLAFIDINMEDDDSGIQLAKKIKKELLNPPLIVFMSCYPQENSKINSLYTNQLCFLNKPISPEDISEIIFTVKSEIENSTDSLVKIIIPIQGGEKILINTADILYIKKEGDYCILVLTDRRELKTRYLLSYFVKKLEHIDICRSAGGFIINLKYFEKFFMIGAAHKVKLEGCDKNIPVGRQHYPELLKKLEQLNK